MRNLTLDVEVDRFGIGPENGTLLLVNPDDTVRVASYINIAVDGAITVAIVNMGDVPADTAMLVGAVNVPIRDVVIQTVRDSLVRLQALLATLLA